ncbi:MAG: cyclase family protein [Acidimicrobiales bacterium]
MRMDHLHHHISRRQLLGNAAKLGAGAAVTIGGATVFGSGAGADNRHDRSGGGDEMRVMGDYDDSLSIDGAYDGSWAAATSARYGPDDQRGTLNEVTPRKTAKALRMLEGSSKVVTHNLGHLMINGFPGFVTFPPRKYDQRLTFLGYTPNHSDYFSTTTPGLAGEDEWRAADRASGPLAYNQGAEPFGANKLSGHEERFPEGGTYQLATQLDGLSHIGVEEHYYNGFNAKEFNTPTGVAKLGMEEVGPIVTRGLLLDVLGYKQKQGSGDVQTINGKPVLNDTYRITVEDLKATMRWERIRRIEAGDVVLIRTGWDSLADDPDLYARYLAAEPGIYMAEAKFLADHRPAIIGSDGWALELVGVPDPQGFAFPVHTELIPKRGIRIGESIRTNSLAEAGIHKFVYFYMPQYAAGATAGNTAPVALTAGRR